MNPVEDLPDFIESAPTSWHAARELGNRLAALDFIPLTLEEKWTLEKGKKYFVIQEGSVGVFALPKKVPQQIALIAAHTDSPGLKLKPQPEIDKHNLKMLGVEVYGSPILPTWVNRDLAIAGRVIVQKKNKEIEEHLVLFEDSPVFIPLLAPHLDREAYKNGLKLNKQDHLPPIASLNGENLTPNYLERLLKRQLSYHQLLDFDLFLVPIDPPRFIGEEGEMLASPRLDNLASVHAGLIALENLETPSDSHLSMGIFWDHEEVGSSTRIGAESPFFSDLFSRICALYKLSTEAEIILRHHSFCLSVDMVHGFNPNYEKKYDPNHLPHLGKGITLKYDANMRYSTNGKGGSYLTQLCDKSNLNIQKFVNRSDIPSGSTIGPIFATKLGIETVDVGIPQLSMHAAREVISCQDHNDLTVLLTHFLKEGL